jgi:hypothetical protein
MNDSFSSLNTFAYEFKTDFLIELLILWFFTLKSQYTQYSWRKITMFRLQWKQLTCWLCKLLVLISKANKMSCWSSFEQHGMYLQQCSSFHSFDV